MVTHVIPEVIGDAKKLLKVALSRRYGYIIYTVSLTLGELNPIMGKFMTYEFHFGIAKVDFVGIESYLMFSFFFLISLINTITANIHKYISAISY